MKVTGRHVSPDQYAFFYVDKGRISKTKQKKKVEQNELKINFISVFKMGDNILLLCKNRSKMSTQNEFLFSH